MTKEERIALYEKTVKMLKPALERVASDPEFRNKLELTPLKALDELSVELDQDTRAELEGRRFSEFWSERRKVVEGPVEVRDLPPGDGVLEEKELETVAGGLSLSFLNPSLTPTFAPPYVPVAPSPVRPPDPLRFDKW